MIKVDKYNKSAKFWSKSKNNSCSSFMKISMLFSLSTDCVLCHELPLQVRLDTLVLCVQTQ